MNAQRPLSPSERDLAVYRLRRLTVGTAIAAVAGFGSIAALTFHGHATTSAVTDTTAAATNPTTGQQTTSATSTATVAPLQPAATTPTAVSGGGQVSTGGS